MRESELARYFGLPSGPCELCVLSMIPFLEQIMLNGGGMTPYIYRDMRDWLLSDLMCHEFVTPRPSSPSRESDMLSFFMPTTNNPHF